MSREMRTDVYDTGCGWRDCPQCGPLIELEIEDKHRAAIGWPTTNLVGEWLAQERGQRVEHADDQESQRDVARKQAREARERIRAKRVLTKEQETEATGILFERGKRLRGSFKAVRREWLSEVWLELLNPTLLVCRREARLSFEKKVKRAISRAQRKMQRSWETEKLFVFTGLKGELI